MCRYLTHFVCKGFETDIKNNELMRTMEMVMPPRIKANRRLLLLSRLVRVVREETKMTVDLKNGPRQAKPALDPGKLY